MLARAEIRIDPLPVQPLVRSLERRGPNNLLEGGSIRHLAANAHAFFEGDRESHIYRVEDWPHAPVSAARRWASANHSFSLCWRYHRYRFPW